ncbi:MAG: hypothetical protein LAP39_02750 [Acidobacteriia bacterium]|nr:hypothetical protein [Terriglobia bacterium]
MTPAPRLASCRVGVLLALAVTGARSEAPPDPAEQDRLLTAMHQYADQYVSNLPNFLCEQVTRQFEAGKKSNRWHKGDTLTTTLTFHRGREQRKLALVNGKAVEPGQARRHGPLTTEGEFGILLSRVLGADSKAYFTWSRWETLRGKRLAVFDYSVDKQQSTLTLSLSDLAKATVPYTGSVWGDPATGAVWRITDTATEIPPALLTRQIATTIDYGEVLIGEKKYLLPVEATVSLLLETKKVRNEMAFQGYRKFEADSVITFGPDAPPGESPAPKP